MELINEIEGIYYKLLHFSSEIFTFDFLSVDVKKSHYYSWMPFKSIFEKIKMDN